MSIFDRRVAFKPFEYPDVVAFKDAINHSYWLVSEWNFISDVHDFHVKLSPSEQNVVRNTLLAISQIEVSVKRFWTKLGERFPKPEFEQVGVTFGECFADGTEILTPKGWADLASVRVGDEVVQFHPDSTLSVTSVRHKVDQAYVGTMVRFHKASTELLVTPNHRMVHYDRHGVYTEALAAELRMRNTDLKLPEAASLRGGSERELSFRDRLRLALQADGNRRYYRRNGERIPRGLTGQGAEYEVRVRKERKIARLDWILEHVEGVSVSRRPIPSRPGMVCYTVGIDADYDYKRLDWVTLHGKTAAWCQDFVEELAEWDGTRLPDRKDCRIKFGSTCEAVADVAQMVGVAAGYRTHRMIRPDTRRASFQDAYVVSFTANRERVTLPPLRKEMVEYDGMVRCVTVDSGAVVTRWQGKTFISGNSEVRHADAYSHLLQVLNLNQDFELLLQNPAIQGRVDYLTKYLKGAADNANESYTLTLALFAIFIENVSLFSQFAIIKSFNKYKNVLKDIDNVVQATQKEEVIHALFGVHVIQIIQREHPEWFNADFYKKIERACVKAYDAEVRILDWIFAQGELSFLPQAALDTFIRRRFNDSVALIGGQPVFAVDPAAAASLAWFEEELHAPVNTDFFHKKPTTYSKKVQSITSEDLF